MTPALNATVNPHARIQARGAFFAALAFCLSNVLSDACAADAAPQAPDATRVSGGGT